MSVESGAPADAAVLWVGCRRRPGSVLRDLLERQHVGLVHRVARQVCRRMPSMDPGDLAGAGSLGLMHAIERFDRERGLAFSTYAVRCIRGAILDDLRARDWMSRGARVRARRIDMA